jgi:hypothetical protein
MIALSSDVLLGIVIGFVVATVLFSGQNTLGQVARQSPFGCLMGVLCLAVGLVLLVVGGYVRVQF